MVNILEFNETAVYPTVFLSEAATPYRRACYPNRGRVRSLDYPQNITLTNRWNRYLVAYKSLWKLQP